MAEQLAETIPLIDAPDGLVHLGRAVAVAIPCDAWSVMVFRQDASPELVEGDYPIPVRSENEAYARATYLLDPFFHAFMAGRGDGLWRIADVVSGDVRKRAFFREYWRHLVQSDAVCFVARVPGDAAVCLSMARSKALPRYSRAEHTAMIDVAPLVVALARRGAAARLGRGAMRRRSPRTLEDAFAAFAGGRLTPREHDVVWALAQGHAPESSAHALGISPRAVRNHMKSVYAKLGVASRAELFAEFIRAMASEGIARAGP